MTFETLPFGIMKFSWHPEEYKVFHKIIHCNVVYTSEWLETTSMPIRRGSLNHNTLYPYCGTLSGCSARGKRRQRRGGGSRKESGKQQQEALTCWCGKIPLAALLGKESKIMYHEGGDKNVQYIYGLKKSFLILPKDWWEVITCTCQREWGLSGQRGTVVEGRLALCLSVVSLFVWNRQMNVCSTTSLVLFVLITKITYIKRGKTS